MTARIHLKELEAYHSGNFPTLSLFLSASRSQITTYWHPTAANIEVRLHSAHKSSWVLLQQKRREVVFEKSSNDHEHQTSIYVMHSDSQINVGRRSSLSY